jgi:hypothetical protein
VVLDAAIWTASEPIWTTCRYPQPLVAAVVCCAAVGSLALKTKLIVSGLAVSARSAVRAAPLLCGRCTGLMPARSVIVGFSGNGADSVLPLV